MTAAFPFGAVPPPTPKKVAPFSLPSVAPLGLLAIYGEFAAPLETPLTEMVKGGVWVPTDTDGGTIPTVPPISLLNFVGATAPARVTIQSITGAGVSNVNIVGNGLVADFDIAHPNGGVAGQPSVSSIRTAVVSVVLDKPATPICWLTADAAQFSPLNGWYLLAQNWFLPPTMPGGNPQGAVGAPTNGVTWSSSGSDGQAQWQCAVEGVPTITNPDTQGVILTGAAQIGTVVSFTLRFFHSLSVLAFIPVAHQGTGRVVFQFVLQFRDGFGVVRDSVPLSITMDTSGQLTASY